MQKVKLGYTQSGIAGFFTGGMMAVHLTPDAVREIKSDPNAAYSWARRFHFEFDGYHRSWQLTQETLDDVHQTIVSLTMQYDSGLITPFELIHAITGLKEGLGSLIHSDMAGLTCPNTGLKVNTMQRKPVDTGNDEEEVENLADNPPIDWKGICVNHTQEIRTLTDKNDMLAAVLRRTDSAYDEMKEHRDALQANLASALARIEALRADFAFTLFERFEAKQEADSLRGVLNALHDSLHNAILS